MIVRGEGPKDARVCIFGEGPGINEDRIGRPFVGVSGDFLNKALELAGLAREQVWIDNIVKVRCTDKAGKDRPPTSEEIDQWTPEVLEVLGEIEPEVVITLGTTATRFFLPELDAVGGLETLHGTLRQSFYVRTPEYEGVRVYPAYHPAAGLHNPRLLTSFFWDFFKLRENCEDAEKDGLEETWAGLDTEGTIKEPFCVTTWLRGRGEWKGKIEFPSPYREIKTSDFALHNSLHDLQVLYNMGVTLAQFHDTMIMAYLLGFGSYDLNESGGGGGVKGLKELCYRYFGERWGSYPEMIQQVKDKWEGEYEVEVARKFTDYIEQALALPLKPAQIRKLGEYGTKGIWPKSKLRETVEAALGPVPTVASPPEPTIHDIPFDDLKTYAIKDAEMTGRLAPVLWKRIERLELQDAYYMDLATVPMIAAMERRGLLLDMDRLEAVRFQLKQDEEALREDLEAMVPGLEPTKAESIRAAFKEVGVEVRQRTGTGKVSTARVVLDIHKDNPFVAKLAEWREVYKLNTTFIPALERFRDPDTGRLHPHYRITNTATGRLSAHSPNLMAFPTRTERGKMLRSCLVASEGYEILSADLDQIEMRIMADESGDERMIQAIWDGLDLHTYTASLVFGIPMEQVHKKKHRQPAKSIGFLVIYEGGPSKLKEQMAAQGIEESLEYWERLIQRWYEVYRAVEEYQHKAHTEALTYGYVRDRWGRIRWALGVHAPRKDLRLKAEREASNFKIQAGAQGLLKRAMARIWREMGKWDAYPLLQIHDELIFEVKKEHAHEFEAYVAFEMAADEPLFKVPISASGKRGPDLGAVKD